MSPYEAFHSSLNPVFGSITLYYYRLPPITIYYQGERGASEGRESEGRARGERASEREGERARGERVSDGERGASERASEVQRGLGAASSRAGGLEGRDGGRGKWGRVRRELICLIYPDIFHIPSHTFVYLHIPQNFNHIPLDTPIYFKIFSVRNMRADRRRKNCHNSSPRASPKGDNLTHSFLPCLQRRGDLCPLSVLNLKLLFKSSC